MLSIHWIPRVQALKKASRSLNTKSHSKFADFEGFGEPSWSVFKKLEKLKSGVFTINDEEFSRILDHAFLKLDNKLAPAIKSNIEELLSSMREIQRIRTDVESRNIEDFSLRLRPDVPNIYSSRMNEPAEANVGVEESAIFKNAQLKEYPYFVVPRQKNDWEDEVLEGDLDDIIYKLFNKTEN